MWRIAALAFALSIQAVWSDGTGIGTKLDSPCQVKDGDHVYDLSELAERDYWEYKYIKSAFTGEDPVVLYLSFCHPIRNAPVTCSGENVGVCEATQPDGDLPQEVIGSRGQVSTTGPVVTEEGWLRYTYENGSSCKSGIQDSTYKTYIHFRCARDDDSDMEKPILMSHPGCELNFAWMTKAACPKAIEKKNDTCIVQFSNSQHILNLHTLHSPKYYNVSSSKAKYELNICGAVTDGHCGVNGATICDVTNTSAPVVWGALDGMSLEWEDVSLVLDYKYSDKHVKIRLFCERTATTPSIHFVEKTDTTLIFAIKTVAVCSPEAPNCVIEDDEGNVYDLRSLRKKEGNWEVIDDRDDLKDQLFHINICGQVNEGRYYQCPPGPIGACQTSFYSNSAYNLGYVTSHPHVNEDKSITVVYTGGDPCKNGKHARSTRINLICNDIEMEPVLIEETSTCEYIFTWLTPAACPRHMMKGTNCTVKDPLYGNSYDLNSLRNRVQDYNVTDGVHNYLINLCGPLISTCNGEKGKSGVCQVKGTEQFSAGQTTSNITFNDGTLVMNYYNGTGSCAGNKSRSTQIIFLCDHDKSGRDGPLYIDEEGSCTYHFIWQTRHACPPYSIVDCSYVTEKGVVYDLSKLSSSSMNEEYYTSDHKKKFVLNVCRSVVHSKDSRCPYDAGACVIDMTKKDDALNIGRVQSGPYLEQDVLKIKYTQGEPCNNSSQLSETVIEFKCDKEELYPYPQLIAQEGCKYIFEWKTPDACPVELKDHSTSSPEREGTCTAKDDFTGYIFDLNPLKNKTGYEIMDDDKVHIILNVCEDVSPEKCTKEATGACTFQHSDHTDIKNAGKANANLQYHLGFLSLHYTGGDVCENGEQRSTLISFICGPENAAQKPVLIHDDKDQCIFYINWYTDLACERRINCYVDTWEERLDLTPLIRSTGNYEVSNPQNPKEKFYLNVCRPLNHIIGLNCRPGSSACLSSMGSESLSLGQPITTPQYIYPNEIQIIYSHGSVCPTNSGLGISSRISFICDASAGKGSPVYKALTDDCQHMFEWRTALACENKPEIPDSNPVCQIKFESAKANIDLKPLNKPEGYTVKFGDQTFKINVCGSACNGSGVCTSDGVGYGLSSMADLQWDYDKLKLIYYGGDHCSDALSGQRTTSIFFSCDMSAGLGNPVPNEIMNDLKCSAVFDWKTNLTCVEAIYKKEDSSTSKPVPDDGSQDDNDPSPNDKDKPAADQQQTEPETQYSSTSTVISSVLVITGVIFVIVLFLFKSEKGRQVMSSARRFFGMKGYSNISQSRLESSTLIGPASSARMYRVDESDDDLLTVVT